MKTRTQRGFSLVELLVALALLALALTVVVHLFYREGRVRARLRERAAAVAWLEATMERLRAMAPLTEGSFSWDLSEDTACPPGVPKEEARLLETVAPWEEDEGVQHVTLRLVWGSGEERRSARLERLLPARGSP